MDNAKIWVVFVTYNINSNVKKNVEMGSQVPLFIDVTLNRVWGQARHKPCILKQIKLTVDGRVDQKVHG